MYVAVPGAPRMLARESSVMNNSITFVWEAHHHAGGDVGGDVGGYVLELDDASAAQFRVRSLHIETISRVAAVLAAKGRIAAATYRVSK